LAVARDQVDEQHAVLDEIDTAEGKVEPRPAVGFGQVRAEAGCRD